MGRSWVAHTCCWSCLILALRKVAMATSRVYMRNNILQTPHRWTTLLSCTPHSDMAHLMFPVCHATISLHFEGNTSLQTPIHNYSFGHIPFIGTRFALEKIDLGYWNSEILSAKNSKGEASVAITCSKRARRTSWSLPVLSNFPIPTSSVAPIFVNLLSSGTIAVWFVFSHDGRNCIQRRNITFRIRF